MAMINFWFEFKNRWRNSYWNKGIFRYIM